MAVLESKQLHL